MKKREGAEKDKIVTYIHYHPECTSGDLCKYLDVRPKTIYSCISTMIKNGELLTYGIQRYGRKLTYNGTPNINIRDYLMSIINRLEVVGKSELSEISGIPYDVAALYYRRFTRFGWVTLSHTHISVMVATTPRVTNGKLNIFDKMIQDALK